MKVSGGCMGDGNRTEHGGDIATARRLFPEAPEPWIDLSTGINPFPYPLPTLPLSAWTRLPGAEAEAALLAAARNAYRVPDGAGVVAVPGTQILVSLLPRLFGRGPAAVLGPTYAEHALAWRRAGAEVRAAASLAEIGDAATLVLVNPNNPDGRIVPPARLAALGHDLARRGGLLVVDEAFADFVPAASLVPDLPPATIVLRSFGKTYGLAGLRLGFAVAGPAEASALREALGPWAVSGPAQAIGAAALADAAWLAAARTARASDADRLAALLAPHGEVLGRTPLFRLLRAEAAPALFARCGRAGVYVRRFAEHPDRLRFGLPAGDEAWRRLEEALS